MSLSSLELQNSAAAKLSDTVNNYIKKYGHFNTLRIAFISLSAENFIRFKYFFAHKLKSEKKEFEILLENLVKNNLGPQEIPPSFHNDKAKLSRFKKFFTQHLFIRRFTTLKAQLELSRVKLKSIRIQFNYYVKTSTFKTMPQTILNKWVMNKQLVELYNISLQAKKAFNTFHEQVELKNQFISSLQIEFRDQQTYSELHSAFKTNLLEIRNEESENREEITRTGSVLEALNLLANKKADEDVSISKDKDKACFYLWSDHTGSVQEYTLKGLCQDFVTAFDSSIMPMMR